MKKYIKESTSNPKFKWIEDEYLGGNMLGVYGQLADGTYFYGDDGDCFVWFLDTDPREMFKLEYSSDWNDWLADHDIGDTHTEKDGYQFWIALFRYCKKNNIKLYNYVDYDAAIQELKECL